jgi:hypothetical protein
MPIGSLARRVIPSSVRKGLRNFLSPRHARTWTLDPGRIPWFDRPDALELLESRRRREHLSDADTELLTRWTTDGYCVAAGIIPADLIDSMLLDLDNTWTAEQPFAGLDFCDLRFAPGDPVAKTSHRDLLQASAAERLYARSHSNWRTSSFHNYSDGAREIFRHQELKRLCSLILDRPAFPQGSINFEYGSAQEAHQDTAVFHVFPPNFIVGAWIACEDISPGCGPLMFYPKSHRQPLFNKFDNYPQTNLRTAGAEVSREYHEHVERLTGQYERQLFLAKKGDVFLWHGMTLHGGSEIENPQLTRKSFVIHYMPRGMNVSGKIVGPFNW